MKVLRLRDRQAAERRGSWEAEEAFKVACLIELPGWHLNGGIKKALQ